MMRITWSPMAIQEIESIVEYISADDPDSAFIILDRIDDLLGLIIEYPQLGKVIEEQNEVTTRESLISGTYRLLYSIVDSEIQIISIRHTKQIL